MAQKLQDNVQAVFNLLKAPAQALLVIGDEGLLKELAGKVKRKKKKARR